MPGRLPDPAHSQMYHKGFVVPLPFPDTAPDAPWQSPSVPSASVEELLTVLGVPMHWPEPSMPHGVLYGAIPKTRSQASALPREGCSLAFDQETRAVPPMVEAAVSASFLRQHMEPQLPMALVTSPPTRAFIQSRPEIRRLWDHYIDFDHEMAARRLSDLKQRKPELVRMVDGSMTFLWKLGWLLLSPFQRTVFLDADVLVLERSLVSSLLRRSLRIHEIAFNVDVARPGSLDPSYQTVRSLVGSNNVMRTRPIGNGDRPQPQNAPQFAKGFPPVCSAMIAFRRQPRVRRLLLYAATRLMSMLNPSDLTNASLGIRQTDQEMLWFELITGDEAQQPSTLLLPEEYYCPATSGSRHLLDFLDRLELGIYPWWGYMKSRFNQRAKYADNDADRFLPGGAKECHALHIHHSEWRLQFWNLSKALPGSNVSWALSRMENELFCWQRGQLLAASAAAARSQLDTSLPPCSVAPHTNLVVPSAVLRSGEEGNITGKPGSCERKPGVGAGSRAEKPRGKGRAKGKRRGAG